MPVLATVPSIPQVVAAAIQLPQAFPQLPQDVVDRFPDIGDWENQVQSWYSQIQSVLQESQTQASQLLNQNTATIGTLTVLTAIILPSSGAGPGTNAGLYISSTHMGYFNGSTWYTYFDNTGKIVGQAGYFGSSSTNGVTIGSSGLAVGTGGSVSGGQTAYNTGTGFWIGAVASVYKFSIGNGSTSYLTWDGTTLNISGTISATTGTIGGWTVGASTLSGTNITLSSAGSITVSDSSSNYLYLNAGTLEIVNHRASSILIELQTLGTILTVPQVDQGTLIMSAVLGSGGSQSAGTYGFTIGFGATASNNYWSIANDGILAINSGSYLLIGATAIRGPSGTALAPGYVFSADATTGMYLVAAGDLDFAVSGTRYLGLHSSKVVAYQRFQFGEAYAAGAVTATGTIPANDSSGTTYNILVHT